jgi:hypothetical protein
MLVEESVALKIAEIVWLKWSSLVRPQEFSRILIDVTVIIIALRYWDMWQIRPSIAREIWLSIQ